MAIKDTDSFNEKCDKVLLYLLSIYNANKEAHALTHLNELGDSTGINPHDAVIHFLIYEKKFIYRPDYGAYIQISPSGIAFISHSSFVQEQLKSETEGKLKWYETENAKQIFDDYPIVKRQRDRSYIVIIITVLMTIISTWIAIAQYTKCK